MTRTEFNSLSPTDQLAYVDSILAELKANGYSNKAIGDAAIKIDILNPALRVRVGALLARDAANLRSQLLG